MFRLIASALIALVAIANGLAHAHGGASVDGLTKHQQAHHAHMSAMVDHGDGAPTQHEEHGASCVLGHCAAACVVILPLQAMAESVSLAATSHDYVDQTFAGLISTSDPPPPKS